MIIRHPRHHSHLCQDPDSILRTFLEQYVLVFVFFPLKISFVCSSYWLLSRQQTRSSLCRRSSPWSPGRKWRKNKFYDNDLLRSSWRKSCITMIFEGPFLFWIGPVWPSSPHTSFWWWPVFVSSSSSTTLTNDIIAIVTNHYHFTNDRSYWSPVSNQLVWHPPKTMSLLNFHRT